MGRPLVVVVLVAVLAGCGSVAYEPADGSDSSIRAVDRPAPDAYTRWSQPSEVIVYWGSYGDSERCEDEPESEPPSEGCKEYRELMERAREQSRRAIEAVAPAAGTEPRVVAELDLDDGARRSELVSWRTSDDKLCTLVRLMPDPGWNQQLVGECTPFAPCHETCVATFIREDMRLVLAGTLSRAAEAIRVTTAADRDTLHVLSGPVVEDSDRRAFMLELGMDPWSRLEVLAGGRVVDTAEPEAGKTWDCDGCEEGEPADPE